MTATTAAVLAEVWAARDGLAVVATWERSGQLGLSPATRRTYHACLVRYVRWLADRPVLEATTADIFTYLEAETTTSARTHSQHRLAIHRFYRWAYTEQLIPADPSAPIWHVHRPHLTAALDDGDLRGLLDGYTIAQERRGLSPTTLTKRRTLLRRFAFWMAPRSVLEATEDDVEMYLDGRPLCARSRYTFISEVHSFFVWAKRQGLVDQDPTAEIIRPRLPRALPRPLSDADLIEALDKAAPDVRAMLALAAFEGLRCKEIAGLQREDILDHLDPPMLIVSSPKGRRQRILPLNPRAWQALQAFGLPRAGPVFRLTDGRRPMSPWNVGQRCNTHLADVGAAGTLHQARHWFASRLYQATRDLRMVQEMLGHADPKTTAIYAQFSPGAATEAVRALTV
jgi:integrase/recombinase XerC